MGFLFVSTYVTTLMLNTAGDLIETLTLSALPPGVIIKLPLSLLRPVYIEPTFAIRGFTEPFLLLS